MTLNPVKLLPVVAILYLALIAFVPDAAAYCGPPRIKLNVAQGERSAIVTVDGAGFWKECFDTGPNAQIPPLTTPDKGIKILFIQGGQSIVLATVDADADLNFSVKVTIPADATIGDATFKAVGGIEHVFNPRTPQRFALWEAGFQVTEGRQ